MLTVAEKESKLWSLGIWLLVLGSKYVEFFSLSWHPNNEIYIGFFFFFKKRKSCLISCLSAAKMGMKSVKVIHYASWGLVYLLKYSVSAMIGLVRQDFLAFVGL